MNKTQILLFALIVTEMGSRRARVSPSPPQGIFCCFCVYFGNFVRFPDSPIPNWSLVGVGARCHAPPRGPRGCPCGGATRGVPHRGAKRGVALPGSARPRGTTPVVDAAGNQIATIEYVAYLQDKDNRGSRAAVFFGGRSPCSPCGRNCSLKKLEHRLAASPNCARCNGEPACCTDFCACEIN